MVDSLLAQFEVIENEAIAARKLREREDKNRKYKEEYEAAIEEDEFHAMYLSDPQVYPYLTKSIHFRQQVLLQLGIILHFLQYVLSGALPKVELSLDDQSVPNINKKVWLNQSITNLKKRIDGTWFSSRNCKSFGLELLFRHELELEKFKNGEFENNIDEGAADDDEMEVTTAPVAISVPFPKTNIERIFGNPPTLDELKDRAER